MDVGLTIWLTEYSIGPVEFAVAAEERGFESILLPEHSNIPVSRRTPFPGGIDLPREYSHLLDPFVALAAMAATTERIRLGTGVCLVAQRDPVQLAKEVATLDVISRGRVLLGIGAGWNLEEMENHGTDPSTRFAVMAERVAAIRALWSEEAAAFDGEHVHLDATWQWPKPVQRPGPPVLVAGHGPRFADRVIAYGDGWLSLPAMNPRPLDKMITELQQRAADAGRGSVPVTVYGARPDGLDELVDAGVDRVILPVPCAGADVVLPVLDHYAGAAGTG